MSSTMRRTSRRRPHGDDGQAVTWLIVVGLLAMGMIAMKLALPLAEGGDRLGKGQTGAESAALAAAKDIKDRWVFAWLDDIRDEGDLPDLSCSARGRGEADQFADRNDEQVVSYCYDVRDDRVRVEVENQDTTSTGHRVKVKAEAKVGMPWGACSFASRPSPSTTTTPPPDPVFLNLTCGGFVLRYEIDPDTGRLELKHDGQLDDLLDSLEPRLTR